MKKTMQSTIRRSLLAILLLLPLGPAAFAQNSEPAAQPAAATPSRNNLGAIFADAIKSLVNEGSVFVPNGQSAQPVPGKEGEPEKFQLNFNNAPVEQVLKFMSDLTKKVVLKSDEVQGQFNIINPGEVTKERALEIIDAAFLLKGYTFIESDQMIIVMTVAAAKQKGLEVEAGTGTEETGSRMKHQVIKLKYASPSQLKDALAPLMPETSNMIADERTQSLVITDTASNIQRITELINELDKEDVLSNTAVQVFRLKYLNANEIGRNLDDLLASVAQSGMSGDDRRRRNNINVEVITDRETNSIIVSAPKDAIDSVSEFINKLDRPKSDELQTQNFTLQHGDATEVAQTLNSIVQSRMTQSYRPVVSADSRTNTIIISAYPEDVLAMGSLIRILDSKDSYEKITRVFKLNNADAILLRPMLEQLINQEDAATSTRYRYWGYNQQQKDVSIIEDQRMNALVVTAKPGEMPMIEDMIEQLDQPLPESAEEPRVYQVKHVRASDLAYLVNNLFQQSQNNNYYFYSGQQNQDITGLSGKVKVIADTTTNSIIVIAATPRAFSVIEKLIEKLDRISPEFGGTRVINLKNASAVELADQLNELFQEDRQGGANRGFYWYLNQSSGNARDETFSNLIGNVRIVSETRTNSLLVTTNSQYFETIEQIINELDREIAQVLVEVLIVEVTDLKDNELGINWPDNIPITTSLSYDGPYGGLALNRATVLTQTSFQTVLNALGRYDKTNVLARPNILTADNKSAYVEVVEEVPVIGSISQNNISTSQSIDFREPGLKLTVVPRINDEDTVTINVNLETGQVLDQFSLKVNGSEIPAFARRTVTTELTVNNEETAVLSGVIDQSVTKVDDGIPGLMHIPVIGSLFKSHSNKSSNKELMVFITPYILNDKDDRQDVLKRQQKRLEQYDVYKKSLMDLNIHSGVDGEANDAQSSEK
ncbi:MAG: hypothetical protein GC154_20680 [bacterium]|nr:hypothetical protein [bacterium]